MLIVLVCLPLSISRPLSQTAVAEAPSSKQAPARPAAAGGLLKPGTPAVGTGQGQASKPEGKDADAQGNYGWLFPVLTKARGNCVVYEVRLGATTAKISTLCLPACLPHSFSDFISRLHCDSKQRQTADTSKARPLACLRMQPDASCYPARTVGVMWVVHQESLRSSQHHLWQQMGASYAFTHTPRTPPLN